MQSKNNYKVMPAQRLQMIEEYYFSRKLKEVAQLNVEGKNIISLAIGSPDMPPSEQTINKLCEVAHQPTAHGYQPTKGTPELLTAMAGFYKRWYGVEVDAATEVLPLIGSKEGILHATLALANVGDKVLVPNPGYPTYSSLTRLLGVDVVYYDLQEENGWQPDFEELEAMDLSDVKIMWTNYPHMPTGGAASMDTYEKLVDFALRHSLVIINDNPYSFILNEHPLSIMQVEGAKKCCIEFNSMSKSHNMPGWRVGMCVSNTEIINWMLKVKSNIDSGTFRGIQLAAAEAYNNNTDEWHYHANITTYAKRRHIAEQIMESLGCVYDKQQVGMFLWGKTSEQYPHAEELTERVLHEASVFITPGFIFGSRGEHYVRISLCAKEEQLEEALNRVKRIDW
ncbi:MAG: aminotransferase class I/II-fold pyridoxal phosphate-dependent enzyme [Prevotella sp.]|nr:aminotransferase class I/II-fold pyridoxal phosphate-dependent enzyme [Prevotella sp.]